MDALRSLIQKVRSWCESHSRWIAAIMIASTGLAAAIQSRSESIEIEHSSRFEDIDTSIPVGHVLVPVDVINYEALDSVLGSYGVVDLFASDPRNGRRTFRVASRIKILRAPRNPSHFAVLAPDSEAASLVRHEGGFFVTVQNPEGPGTTFEHRRGGSHVPTTRLRVEVSSD